MNQATVSGSSLVPPRVESYPGIDPVRPRLWPMVWVAALLLLTSCGILSKSRAPEGDGKEERMEEGALALKAQIYEALGRMNRAQARGETEEAEAALDEAMDGLRYLYQTPGGLENADGRELYRSVVTAYEQYYGVSDTLSLQYSDIFAYRDEMFAEMNDVRAPLQREDVELPPPGPVQTTIVLERNHLIQQSIEFLQRSPEKHLYRWISRSATYFPMFERILREEGVPDELKYLAMIESALLPKARSHASAVGLWQFMAATGREYGLERTHWIDERMDPEKSTRAAARYLKWLHERFDDWYLALAAYNSGPGRVSRAVRQHGQGATFWDIYDSLPRETRNYVPMFVATATVLTNPQAYNISSVEPGPRFAYDVAEVEGMLDLRLVADLAGTDVETIQALNPEIRQWTTPPTQSVYRLRVPSGRGTQFAQAYAALPPDHKRSQTEYVVRRGDSLGKIARRYGTTVSALQDLNGISGSLIRTGQMLYVPVPYEATTGVAGVGPSDQAAYDDRPQVTYASETTPAPRARTTSASNASGGNTRVTYRVRRGDNLSKIAQKYGVRVSDIQSWNDLAGDRIQSGQRLVVYPGQAGTAPARSSSASRGERTTYKVRRGDNLTGIARKYGVGVSDLRAWNNLTSDRIRSGQRLTIYASGSGNASSGGKRWVAYYVRRGENLTTIARKVGASVSDIRQWNALRSDRLKVGQKLALYTARL